MSPAIAIVGMACRYPGARTPGELWENSLAGRRAFRRLPANRFCLADYYSADKDTPDKTYATEAAVLEDYVFDRVRFRVPGSTFRAVDMTHWLALDIASQALADAGFAEGHGLPKEATGVLLGNTLAGEFARANVMRLRWPYIRRVTESLLLAKGWPEEQRQAFLQQMEESYKAPFPAVGEESLAGGMANTIAGRICNYFDLKGGGYILDGACASSLLAVSNACVALTTGDLDVAIAGGVDLSLDPFELVGFAKTGALASERMRIYDACSAGFWPGEGCGVVILMRQEDAILQQRPIYALISGWGISSDGAGGITRPEVEGQKLALDRSYRRAGYPISTVAYFEGHGTGTSVGDSVELQVLTQARRQCDATAPPAAIGSIKGSIGHTKAAAGIAGLIRATMALQAQLLPPTVGCEQPHPALADERPALRVLRCGEIWPADQPLHAGVSAMGFGGINTHIALQGQARERRQSWTAYERTLVSSAQDTELFLLSGATPDDLRHQAQRLRAIAASLSYAELSDLASTLATTCEVRPSRAAVVAGTPEHLAQRLERLISWLDNGVVRRLDFASGVCLGAAARVPRLGYLFPGQSAPVYLAGGIWAERFQEVSGLYARAGLPAHGAGVDTAVAQPAIVTASQVGLLLLQQLGLSADVAIGHSLGELTGLHWAGALDEDALLRIAHARGQAMAEQGARAGGMASLSADEARVAPLLQGCAARIACYNSQRQTVVSGEASAIETICRRAMAEGLQATRLPVSHAFHSPLVAGAVPELASALAGERLGRIHRRLISTVIAAPITANADIAALLCRQVTSPVQFVQALHHAASEVDLWIEVGPGAILTGLVREMTETPVVALDAGSSSLRGLFVGLAAAFVLGASPRVEALYATRFTRPFALDRHTQFLSNPCESAPPVNIEPLSVECLSIERSTLAVSTEAGTRNLVPISAPEPPEVAPLPLAAAPEVLPAIEVLRKLVAERAELPTIAVRDQDRLLSDLNLNSITVSQIVIEAARRLGWSPPVAPLEFADATLTAAANALAEVAHAGAFPNSREHARFPDGVASWLRAFTVEQIQRPRPLCRTASRERPAGAWQVLSPPQHVVAEQLRHVFASVSGRGLVVCLPPAPDERDLPLLLESAHRALATPDLTQYVLVQHRGGGEAFAKTLFLERPDTTVCVVDVPIDHPDAVGWIVAEALAAQGYSEVHYDAAGTRTEPVLRPLPLVTTDPQRTVLGYDDVLLVTGGGKGIAAECALALARDAGNSLLLLGRSSPDQDTELASNLNRMQAYGIRAHYVMADVTDANAIRTVLRDAQERHGVVTALLHGAGTNVPRLLSALDINTFRATVGTKVTGARNVLAALDPDRLRLFIAFGSLIARTGLRGEADYAVANAWLTRLVEEWGNHHPHCHCLTLEWSAWSGVGMAERLGRVDLLSQQGITAIPPDEGVRQLRHLLARPALPTCVVVTGRYGEPSTLPLESCELPFMRFLETPRIYYPRVELIADVELSVKTDPYLEDHLFQGEHLVPGVMALEAAAQVAGALAGTEAVVLPEFEEVRFLRPLIVSAEGSLTLRIAALQRANDRIEVTIRCGATDFQAIHFQAHCRFDPERLTTQLETVTDTRLHSDPAISSLLPERDLYDTLLFQTGRFRRLECYRHLQATECLAEVRGDSSEDWFGPYLPADLRLGDPGARDAFIHCIQACIPHLTLLPIGIDRLTIDAPLNQASYIVHAIEVENAGDLYIYDVTVYGNDGAVCERWRGLRLWKVADRHTGQGLVLPLLGVYLERKVNAMLPHSKAVKVTVQRQERSDEPACRQIVDAPAAVCKRPDGKPELPPHGPGLSRSHSGRTTFTVMGIEPLACDAEAILPRTEAVWQDLLGPERYRLAQLIARDCAESLSVSATRVWTAIECLRKSGQTANATLHLLNSTADGWVCLASGALTLASYHTELRDENTPVVFCALAGSRVYAP